MSPWLRNSRGRPDALLTLAAAALLVVLVRVLLAAWPPFQAIDAGLALALLGPLAAYTTKRVRGGKADAGEP